MTGRRVLLAALVVGLAVLPGPSPARSMPARRTVPFQSSGVIPFGSARFFGSPANVDLSSPAVAIAGAPDGGGYWVAAADGGVFAYGDARFFGSAGSVDLMAPIMAMAASPTGRGYWLAGLDGGVFNYGDAGFFGSAGSLPLNQPVVAMTATPTGRGYWLAAADGGIFSYGDAAFQGSTGGQYINAPIVGMAATPTGRGYWLLGADGGVFAFGDAGFLGSAVGKLPEHAVAMAATRTGLGYWIASSDGTVRAFGDAVDAGGDAGVTPQPPIQAMAAAADGRGYLLLDPDAFPTRFSHPAPRGSGVGLAVASVAAAQAGANPVPGVYCNPYGPCEEWCALFASWVWQQAGVPVPQEAFTGAMWEWARRHTAVRPASAVPQAGDGVLFGTGPQNTSTSLHIAVVEQVWPDGAVATVDGDYGPGQQGQYSVVLRRPFLPRASQAANGMPVYGYAVP